MATVSVSKTGGNGVPVTADKYGNILGATGGPGIPVNGVFSEATHGVAVELTAAITAPPVVNSGFVYVVTADAINQPLVDTGATEACTLTFVVGSEEVKTFTLSNSTDFIVGLGVQGNTANLIRAKMGDWITVSAHSGQSWIVTGCRGTWNVEGA